MNRKERGIQEVHEQLLVAIDHGPGGPGIVEIVREGGGRKVYLAEAAVEVLSYFEGGAEVSVASNQSSIDDEEARWQTSDLKCLGRIPSFEQEAIRLLDGPRQDLEEVVKWLPPLDRSAEDLRPVLAQHNSGSRSRG